MIELIPSKDVREYIKETSRTFIDFEKAAIIFNLYLPFYQMQHELKTIAENTKDNVLKAQLVERIEMDIENIEAFKLNIEGFVYSVNSYEYEKEPFVCGYFATADLAYDHGKRQGRKFDIEKYQIVGFNGSEAKKIKSYWNPYLFKTLESDKQVEEHEYGGDAVAKFCFDKKGTLRNFWSSEISHSDEKKLNMLFNPMRFENAYVDIPNPFEAGDIVKLTTNGGYGVVKTTQKEWKEYNEKMKATNCADFSDVNIIVDILLENGHIVHSHINPIFLEKYNHTKDQIIE